MKTSMYFNYTSRSLLRGGQRTVLAVFCVAVGVMAIVALQLVGIMISNAFTTNVRAANGGDILVEAGTRPLSNNDLNYFAQLKSNGTITNYTAVTSTNGSLSNTASVTSGFTIDAVDPTTYPLVTPPTFTTPSNGTISSLLTDNGVIVDQAFIDQNHKQIGDEFDVHIGSFTQSPRLLHVKLAGIVTDTGVLAQSNGVLLVSQQYYQSVTPNLPAAYDTVNVTTTDQAHTDAAAKDLNTQFQAEGASITTVADALKQNQGLVDNVKKFLEIAGLLALLIGGVGIVNTMQVLLSRRKVEIAMLKTTGYRRLDLYLLFGLEAGELGLLGGAIGTLVAVGVSYLVRGLVQQVFGLNIPFVLDPLTIVGGVLIGLLTALIFGLMPIVQAANIRPLNVIRELPGGRVGSFFLTIVLLLVLSVLFCVMAVVILNDVVLGISAVYGTFIFLALLSLFFALVVFLVSILPVPERLNIKYIIFIVACALVSILITLALPTFGYLLLAVTILGFLSTLMPRSWRSSLRMALRNVGRQRARTTTTMLALFVGIFTIGLILILGQDLRDSINNALATNLTYNAVSLASTSDADAIQSQSSSIPGLTHHLRTDIAPVVPVALDGVPLMNLVKNAGSPSISNLGRDGTLYYLGGLQGYDVAGGQVPDPSSITITAGRTLSASDAGTNNVLIAYPLASLEPLKDHIHVGSVITVASQDGKIVQKLNVVGFYRTTGFTINLEPILTTKSAVQAVTPPGAGQSVVYMKIDTAQMSKALAQINKIAPGAFVLNLANIGDFINQYLNYFLLTLTTIAGLSLLAGVIIIANAVALAMLERRRELGILKSVGYTSGTVLSEVLIENGIIGGLGAILAMLLVTFVIDLLSRFVFKSGLAVGSIYVIGLIVGAGLLAMVTATIVAWGAVRVRPLEVLRYE